MKKIIALAMCMLIAVTSLLSLTACKDSSEQSSKAPESTSENTSSSTKGNVTGNVYRNEKFDITFTKPQSWTYYSDEQIAALLNVTVEMLISEEWREATSSSLIDVMAQNTLTGSSMNISFEKSTAPVSVDYYINAYKSNTANAIDGVSYSFGDTTDVTLGKQKYKRLESVADYELYGITMNQYVYVRKVGNYFCAIVVTIPTTDTSISISDIEALFS